MTEQKQSLPLQRISQSQNRAKLPADLLTRAEETSHQGSSQGTGSRKGASQPQTAARDSRKENQIRAFSSATIRAMEGEGNERKFILSFSSEEPYERFWGKEILDHNPAAVDLTRLNTIGVLLFNHNRDKVIGKIGRAWIENQRGMAEVEFDSDEESEVIFQKVKSGTLKGVSVGYKIGVIEEVTSGKISTDGRFTGPCDVAREWMPYEISIVSVPADATVGVGRELKRNTQAPETLTCFEAQLQINKNRK